MPPEKTVAKCAAICHAVADEKGADVAILLVGDATIIADYFVLCTGSSKVHIRAIAEGVVDTVRERLRLKPRTEGKVDSEWVVLDYGDVVLHIFSPELREFYDLERLWSEVEIIHWNAETGEELRLPGASHQTEGLATTS